MSTHKREFLTVTVAAHTKARLETLSRLTGLSRGRLVDMALDGIEPCESCHGRGRVDTKRFGDTVECSACRGLGIHPTLTE